MGGVTNLYPLRLLFLTNSSGPSRKNFSCIISIFASNFWLGIESAITALRGQNIIFGLIVWTLDFYYSQTEALI